MTQLSIFLYNSPMSAEHPAQHDPNVLRSADRPLAGKTAIVTGGSRDVGAAIVESLAKEGVRVVFSYNNKPKRAEDVLGSVADFRGEAHAIAADISTIDGRNSFFTSALDILGGKIDFLILSTSGPTPQLNEIASNDLLDQALPSMQNGGAVIRMQSVPGHFMPQLRGSFSLKEYNSVAESKYPDLKSLRKRIPEMEEHGVRFLEVCPPIVTGTNNVRFAHRIDPTAEQQHYVVSDRLGLPHDVTPEQVGNKIVDLLSNPDINSGYTEFFDGVDDAQTTLEALYDVPQVYVNTLEMQETAGETKRGIGRAIASFEQIAESQNLKVVDTLALDEDGEQIGILTVTPEHAKGHFSEEKGLPRILPGHIQISAAIETIGMIERQLGNTRRDLRLIGFDHAVFLRPVLADGSSKIIVKPTSNGDGTYNVEILREGDSESVASINRLRLRRSDETEKEDFSGNQLLEGAFQTLGLVGLDSSGDNLPLLLEIGRTEIVRPGIKAGEGIKYDAIARQNRDRRVEGSVSIHSEGRIIGMVTGIKTALVPKQVALRLLK